MTAQVSSPAKSLSGLQVLVVDDEPDALGVGKMISQSGANVRNLRLSTKAALQIE